MPSPMKRALIAVALAACATSKPTDAPRPAAAAAAPQGPASARWKPIVEAEDRIAEDKKLDAGRKPAEMLEFLDLKPGMKVAELGAGGGYTSELLVRAVGEQGKVYAENPPQWAPFAGKLIDQRTQKHTNLVRVDRAPDDPLPPEAKDLDAVVIMATYHDFVGMGADRGRMNERIFAALQPGGTYTVIDSSAKAGTGAAAADSLHRIDEAFVRSEIEKAGFKLASSSDFLRNPDDARDWSASPRVAGEKRGTSDRFALKFVKP